MFYGIKDRNFFYFVVLLWVIFISKVIIWFKMVVGNLVIILYEICFRGKVNKIY